MNRITSARVERPEYNCRAGSRVVVTLDELDFSKLVYRAIHVGPGEVFYVGSDADIADFCVQTPHKRGGCGGNFKMEDGSVREVRGAWSSRSGVLHALTGDEVVQCTVEDRYVSVEVRREALERLGVTVRRDDTYLKGETYFWANLPEGV
jgi:hypothetical protein